MKCHAITYNEIKTSIQVFIQSSYFKKDYFEKKPDCGLDHSTAVEE